MRAAIFNAQLEITVRKRTDPRIENPTDAIVRGWDDEAEGF
jgi:hypothetical protein